MATTVHIPKELLEAVDRRARALRISRSKLVVRALEREMESASDWSPEFFERLLGADEFTSRAVDEMMTAIRESRRSREPTEL